MKTPSQSVTPYEVIAARVPAVRKGRTCSASEPQSGGLVDTSFLPWLRYYAFLQEIHSEYRQLLESRIAAWGPPPPGAHLRRQREWESFRRKLDLQIESFYIFAKILVDRIADTFCYHFRAKTIKYGSSHARLSRKFRQICENEGLEVQPPELPAMLSDLQRRVVEYRNDMIEHASAPDLLRSTLLKPGPPRIAITELGAPWHGGATRESEDLGELFGLLGRYIMAMLQFFEANVGKSNPAPLGLSPTRKLEELRRRYSAIYKYLQK
jgi:hypothetical protein